MSLRIVFMGTPEFAVPSLETLLDNDYEVVGVVTAADKRGGRGKKKLIESAVKRLAARRKLPILQPHNLKDPDFVAQMRRLNADLQVVVAFRMLPKVIWSMPPKGTFNLHGSLLPKYRGAAPINWAIINGESETGVTTFFIQQAIDTGDILFQEKMPIGEQETAGDVHDRMMLLGARVVLKTVRAIESDDYTLKKQDDSQASNAPKLHHDTCEIDFDQPTKKVHDFIRGLSPYPAAWTTLDSQELKILRTTPEPSAHQLPPGTFIPENQKQLRIATADGFIQVHELQLAGRRRMSVVDFLNGYVFR